MARSMATPDQLPEHIKDTLPVERPLEGRIYGVKTQNGHHFQTEKMEDGAGTIYSQDCRVDLAFGSGTHGYTFASIQGNALYQVPLTWYEDINEWDLSPGYSGHDHARFERRISDDCVNCHLGQVKPEGLNTNRFLNDFVVEASIGCERCHGAGAEHVSFHTQEGGSASRPTADPIVNPAKLPVDQRDSVCFQCHLDGESRVLRAGRSAYDFRPGDRISDIWVTLVNEPVHGEPTTNSQAVSHVEQMVSSKCYQQSNGDFHCNSCHDPHEMPSSDQRLSFYNSRCLVCHQDVVNQCGLDLQQRQTTSPADSCVTCHMPKREASDIPHTARTDHRVLRSYEAAEEVIRTALSVFQADRENLPPDEVQRAFGLTLAIRARTQPEVEQAYSLLAPLLSDSSDDAEILRATARLLLQLGDFSAAGRMIGKAVAQRPQDENILQTQLQIQWATGQYMASLSTVDRLLQLNAWSSSNLRTRAAALAHFGRFEDSAIAARHSLEINPLTLATRELLEHVLKESGDAVEANRQAELIRRLRMAGTTR
ncbi:MAG: hypothetical protein R3C59_12035 [Planctomycetaceae bacterium]